MQQLKADIIIVSAGTAGLTAAVTAAEGGASVIAFEKANHTGGTAIRGNGPFGVESRLQKLRQYTLTKEDAFKIYMDFTQWTVNARLVKAFIDKSADTLDWLEKWGGVFRYRVSRTGNELYVAHRQRKSPASGAGSGRRNDEYPG